MKRKTMLTGTALLLTAAMLLCSCDKKAETTKAPEEQETAAPTTTEETTEAPEETALEETAEVTETSEEWVEETTETVDLADLWVLPDEYEEITLDGVQEHHYISTDYCYIVSDKYVVFLDKDIDVPGDFLVNVDAIIDGIEEELGISSCPEDFEYGGVPDLSIYYDGVDPWEDFYIGTKIPLFLMVDRYDEALISNACADYTVIVSYELFSEDLWNSVPGYCNSDFRFRNDFVDYGEIAHELTHTITDRNIDNTKIMAEGIAEYTERRVIENLADSYPAIRTTLDNRYLYDNGIPEPINAGNAEEIFIGDYDEIDAEHRGAEYTFGRYLFEYLYEIDGPEFYTHLVDTIHANGITYSYGNYDEAIITEYADAMKEAFGDDVFTGFGDWCVAGNVLQDVNGVFP